MIFSSFLPILHKKHALFLLLEVFKLTKNCSKIIYFFPKNSINLSLISTLKIKKDIKDRALES